MPKGPKARGVFQRDRTWWIRWVCTLGHDHRNLSGELKTVATEEHKTKRAEVREARKTGREYCPRLVQRQRPTFFEDILADYMEYSARNKRSHNNDRAKAESFKKRFRHRLATAVTAKDVEDFKAACVEGRSVATVNHYLKFLKAVFNRAIRQGSLTYNPVRPVKLFQEHNARNRCLSPDEETRLLDALPGWFRPLVRLALHTGMRRGELQALKWQDVDFNAGTLRIQRDKAGDGRWVALNSAALGALQTVKREQKIMSPYVFCSPEGKFLHNIERVWRPALRAARIPDFRFHDLRHTFASRLAMAGVDLYTVQRAGGWKTQTMVQRYAHLSPDHIRAAVERLAQAPSASGTGTKTGTRETGEKQREAEVLEKFGAPGGIRTPDPRLRRPMLYPTELQARAGILRG
jgi:integrase